MQYLVAGKLSSFLAEADRHPALAGDLDSLVRAIRRLFTPDEIREHLKGRRLPRIRKILGL